MENAWLIGRIVYGGFFAFNGLNHFMQFGNISGYAAAKEVPLPEVAVVVSGLFLLAGGLSVILGYKPRLGLPLLIIFLVLAAVLVHNFWAVPEEMKAGEMAHFMKNFALAGAALLLMTLPTPWTKSLERRPEVPAD